MLTKSKRQAVPVQPTLECLEDRKLLSAAAAVTGNDFLQVNLVANVAGVAANTDPNLIHPTGISVGPAGPFWVSDSGANVSTLYNTAGTPNALVVAIPGPNGSAPNVTTSPTGQINPAADGTVFLIPGTGPGHGVPAAFIFATADGTIAAWDGSLSPNTQAVTVVDNSGQGASFTGLASGTITTNGTANSFLYAADFRNGKIEVFDSSFKPVSPSPSSPLAANAFQDPKIPPGFSPYNIQQLGGTFFVTYAKVGVDGNPVLGAGQGFVAAFSTTGQLLANFQGSGAPRRPLRARACADQRQWLRPVQFRRGLAGRQHRHRHDRRLQPHRRPLRRPAEQRGRPAPHDQRAARAPVRQRQRRRNGGRARLHGRSDPGAGDRAVRLAHLRAGNHGGRERHGHPANRARE